jgi:hypothetical protein
VVVINRLTVSGYLPDRLRRLLLIVALVICQFSLVQHQLDIERHADGKECTICLAAPGLDHALASGFAPPIVPVAVDSPGALPARFPLSRTPVRRVARSPPAHALHA